MPLVVFEQLDEDDDEADELDGVEDEAHGEGDLTQGCQVVILTLITKKVGLMNGAHHFAIFRHLIFGASNVTLLT